MIEYYAGIISQQCSLNGNQLPLRLVVDPQTERIFGCKSKSQEFADPPDIE